MKVPRVASILFRESVVFQSLPAKIFMFGNGGGGGAEVLPLLMHRSCPRWWCRICRARGA